MTLTQNITLDVARETALHIAGKQFDENSRFLLVTIKEAGEEKSIPAGSTITLNARRPDGSAQSFAGSIQDGKALVEIDQWILEQYGTVYCSVSVVDSGASKLTTLSFRLLVERAEGSGFVLVYVAAANLPAGTYYIPMAGVNYSFTTTQAVPAGGKIYFSSNGTTGKTTNNGATIETLTLTAGSTGTELQGSDIVNFLTQMQANVAAIDGELDSKADKSAIEENLAAGTSLATIDKNSYTPHTTPYLHRISPSGKRCEYDVIGGTVGWNQLISIANIRETRGVAGGSVLFTNNGDGSVTITGTATTYAADVGMWRSYSQAIATHKYFVGSFDEQILIGGTDGVDHGKWAINNGTTYNVTLYPKLIDLTALLGSTIADYAYTLEQATAGSGIAWLRSFGFLTKSYYPYCEPTLESVEATERKAVGKNHIPTIDKSLSKTEVGVTWTVNDDGTISVSGTATGYTSLTLGTIPIDISWGTVTISGISDATNIIWSNISLLDDNNEVVYAITSGSSQTTFNVDLSQYSTATKIRISFKRNSNGIVSGTLKPMVELGSTATDYAPYESHTYPLGNVTLRGIPKLDSSNNIYYDGDKYKASGEITRRYGVVDLGTLNWLKGSAGGNAFFRATLRPFAKSNNNAIFSNGYSVATVGVWNPVFPDDSAQLATTNWGLTPNLAIRDDSYTDATTFKTAMNGVYLVYELATPTTESTDPFTPIQYTGATEAFTTSNDVPVGVEGKYYTDLTLPKLPTANGTYTLKCTVTDGTGIISWVSE